MTTNTQKSTFEHLQVALGIGGFKHGHGGHRNGIRAYMWKVVRRQGDVCLSNDKLQLDVEINELPLGGALDRSVSFSITGEYRPGMWTKLEVYGVSWDDAVEQHKKYELELLTAWDALCAYARKT